MAGRPRGPAEIARDRLRIEDLYFSGWLQADIATKLGLSQATISRDLKWLHKDWLERAAEDVAKHKAKELARIDRLEREYWRAWERTLNERTVTATEKTREDGGKERDKATLRREQMLGDARFLSGVQWCIEQRCKILGVEAPSKSEMMMRGAITTANIEPSDADRQAAIDALYQRVLAESGDGVPEGD